MFDNISEKRLYLNYLTAEEHFRILIIIMKNCAIHKNNYFTTTTTRHLYINNRDARQLSFYTKSLFLVIIPLDMILWIINNVV